MGIVDEETLSLVKETSGANDDDSETSSSSDYSYSSKNYKPSSHSTPSTCRAVVRWILLLVLALSLTVAIKAAVRNKSRFKFFGSSDAGSNPSTLDLTSAPTARGSSSYYASSSEGETAATGAHDNGTGKEIEDNKSDIGQYASDNADSISQADEVRYKQIKNYRKGKALIINIHITHHAGTTFCRNMKKIGPVPSSACNSGDNWIFDNNIPARGYRPWTFDETSEYIPIVREKFHMIGWEFGSKPKRPLAETDWEDPLLVSILIVKHPIDRLFGGSSAINKKYGKSSERTQAQWWEYITNKPGNKNTDNFALDKLSPKSCPSGENTPLECLEVAKDLLERFTFIIDVACFGESMAALADQLGWSPPVLRPHTPHPSAAERFGNETLHNWLIQKNRRDIELYEWARDRAIVKCSDLS